MNRRRGFWARLRTVRIGRCEELLLLGIIALGASYPILREAFPSVIPVLCGLPTPDGTAVTHRALLGKVACAAVLTAFLPLLARKAAGSWAALTRAPAYRVALVVAAVATATLTAYDTCTGFHATARTAEGCACWLTGVVAGCAALAAALLVLAGRALLSLMREVLVAFVEAVLRLRRDVTPLFSRCSATTPRASGILLARRHSGRGPPLLAPSAA